MPPESNHQNNQQLIERLQQGDTNAFDILFYTFEPVIYAYAMKLTSNAEDAKEVVQEVFLKVWEKRAEIDPRYRFESFLYTIAKNLVYNKARHRTYYVAYQKYIMLHDSQTEHVTENTVYFNELNTFVQTALLQMPPVQREVFRLSRMQGLSHGEIAKKMNTSTSNVKNHIRKALRSIREQIQVHKIVPVVFLILYLLF